MPAVSTAQQALFGQAYAIKIGSLKPSDLKPEYRKEIMKISRSMSKKELEAYASTKHKNLPHYTNEDALEENNALALISSDSIPAFVPQGPGKIIPFLDPDSKQKNKGKRNLQNLKDYRDWINDK
jgi:hypothetical protein